MEIGLCRCGCGAKTEIAKMTQKSHEWIAGKPKPYYRFHRKRLPNYIVSKIKVGTGLCECGCNRQTKKSDKGHIGDGYVAGKFRRFVQGHGRRKKFESYFDKRSENECWPWKKKIGWDGYGKFNRTTAQRASYEFHIGKIPAGLEIDHLCRNRICVNPIHLEAVSHYENSRRRFR